MQQFIFCISKIFLLFIETYKYIQLSTKLDTDDPTSDRVLYFSMALFSNFLNADVAYVYIIQHCVEMPRLSISISVVGVTRAAAQSSISVEGVIAVAAQSPTFALALGGENRKITAVAAVAKHNIAISTTTASIAPYAVAAQGTEQP